MSAIPIIANKALHKDAGWNLLGNAAYSPRDSTRIFEHEGLLYLSNGYQPGGILLPDLWKSWDGIRWFLVNASTTYTGWCPMISFGGAIVALGNPVMKSDDGGLTFTTVPGSPPFTTVPNTRKTWWSLVRGDTLMMFGEGKTWWTTDLVTWSSRNTPFYRENYALWDLGGMVYMAAGSDATTPNVPPEAGYPDSTSFNDVWAVDDPITGTWSRIQVNAPWAPRMWPGFAVHGDEMVITAGYNNRTADTNFNDTWVSRDGVNWREITGTPFPHRHYPQVFSRFGRLILNNGNQNPNSPGGVTNDIYELA